MGPQSVKIRQRNVVINDSRFQFTSMQPLLRLSLINYATRMHKPRFLRPTASHPISITDLISFLSALRSWKWRRRSERGRRGALLVRKGVRYIWRIYRQTQERGTLKSAFRTHIKTMIYELI